MRRITFINPNEGKASLDQLKQLPVPSTLVLALWQLLHQIQKYALSPFEEFGSNKREVHSSGSGLTQLYWIWSLISQAWLLLSRALLGRVRAVHGVRGNSWAGNNQLMKDGPRGASGLCNKAVIYLTSVWQDWSKENCYSAFWGCLVFPAILSRI